MANEFTNTTTNAAIIPEIWSARYYDVLLAKLPFIGSITNDYEQEIQNLGDIVNISTIPEFTTPGEVLAEGASGESDAITITGQQLTINTRAYKDVIVTKRAQLQSLPFMDQLRDKMVYAINKKIHADIITAIVPIGANAISYDAGTTLDLADLLEGKELLDAGNVMEDNRVATMGSSQYNDFFNITGFVSRDFIPAGSPLTSGSIATPVLGFEIRPTTLAGNTTYLFHPSFMTMAIQDQLNIAVYDLGVEGIRGHRVNADVLYGIKQLDNKRVVTIS